MIFEYYTSLKNVLECIYSKSLNLISMISDINISILEQAIEKASFNIDYYPYRVVFEQFLLLCYKEQKITLASEYVLSHLLPFVTKQLLPHVSDLSTGAMQLNHWLGDLMIDLNNDCYVKFDRNDTSVVSINPKYLDFINLYMATQTQTQSQVTTTTSQVKFSKSLSEEMYDYSLLMSEIYPDLTPPTRIERNHCTLPQYTTTEEFDPIQEYNLDNIRIPPMFDTLEEKQYLYKVWLHNGGHLTYLPDFTKELHEIFLKQYNQEKRATPEFQTQLNNSQVTMVQILQQRKQALQPNGTLYFENSWH